MKRLLVGGAVLVLCAGGMGTSFAGGNGAMKAPLSSVDPDGCDGSSPGAGTGHGFVIFNAPGKPGSTTDILGEVSLKRGAPDSTYIVRVSENGSCHVLDNVLTTNTVGNGNAHIATDGAAGEYYVVLENVNDDTDGYMSTPVTVK